MHCCQEFIAFVDVVLGSTQRDDVRLATGVGKRDLHLIEAIPNLLDLAASSSDQVLMESLLNQNVSGLLVFLAKQFITQINKNVSSTQECYLLYAIA